MSLSTMEATHRTGHVLPIALLFGAVLAFGVGPVDFAGWSEGTPEEGATLSQNSLAPSGPISGDVQQVAFRVPSAGPGSEQTTRSTLPGTLIFLGVTIAVVGGAIVVAFRSRRQRAELADRQQLRKRTNPEDGELPGAQ